MVELGRTGGLKDELFGYFGKSPRHLRSPFQAVSEYCQCHEWYGRAKDISICTYRKRIT